MFRLRLGPRMSSEVEFDRIAPIYDETRQPPSSEELDVLVELLGGCQRLLDAGVGTGRFAVPLRGRGFEIVGADLSLEMMRRARSKGIAALVRADIRHLPLADRAVDAAFMAHVLQLIPEPGPVLRELGRVTRRCVVIALPEWFERSHSGPWQERRERYRAIAAELGYPLPERGRRYRHTLEELSAIAPPTAVRVVQRPPRERGSDEDRFGRWAAEWFGGASIPPEVQAEILRRMRAELPPPTAADRPPRESRFVAWSSADLGAVPVRSSDAPGGAPRS
jgi:ubiquinone/menaquinone biosynthesis C-methylase UbiE